jgi:hypothetical protein
VDWERVTCPLPSLGFVADEKERHRKKNGGMALLAEPNAPLKDKKG